MKEKKISLQSTVVAGKNQVSADLSGEAALLQLKTGIYYSLDRLGGQIWTLIQKPQKVRALRRFILERYEVDPERCESDLLALLRRLSAEDLIEVNNGPTA